MDLISEVFSGSALETTHRRNDIETWQLVLDNAAYVPVDYLHETLEFQTIFETGLGIDVKDISVVIKHDKKPCAVWPLSYKNTGDGYVLKSFHTSVLPPLFVANTSKKIRKAICKECITILENICRSFNIRSVTLEEPFINDRGVSEWHYEMVRCGAISKVKYELLIDLSHQINDIKSLFRKSYKSLINQGLKLWKVGVLTEGDAGIWNELRQLHLHVAGRVTRSDDSWKKHYKTLQAGKAFLVYLRDEAENMVGAGFFLISNTEASYGIGVYDRSLFDKPLGHVVQYAAICEMQRQKLAWYKIGIRGFLSDIPAPTEKELSIAEFKEGFASEVFPRYALTYDIPHSV